MGKRAGTSIIRPSKRIIYDTTEAVVSFLSENVDTCVDEFLEEWARVSKMVVIAREGKSTDQWLWNIILTLYLVAKMAKDFNWSDVHLLSFDLQTVEFAYASVRLTASGGQKQILTTSFAGLFRINQLYRPTVSEWRLFRPTLLPVS